MGNALPPEFLKNREEMMRFNALKGIKGKKDSYPKRDLKFVLLSLGIILALAGSFFVVYFLGVNGFL